MIKNFRFRFLLTALLTLASAGASFGQKNKIDLNALTDETQKQTEAADELTLVWWIPESFWKVSFQQDSSLTATETEDFLKIIRPYTMLVVVDGRINALGGVTYKQEIILRSSIQIFDAQGNAFRPLGDEKISVGAKSLISMLKPILVNMLGPMGQNMHIFLFPAKNLKSENVVNEFKEGVFTVKLDQREFKWRLPLGALQPRKLCPIDGERLNGAWKFCPFHGAELKSQ